MKKIITLFLFAVAAFTAFAQGGVDGVIQSLRSGNASEMSRYFDDNVEVALPSKSASYSRSQATVVLQDFFQNNGVRSFDVKHKGDNGGSQFCIGTLQTKAGSFRTTFFMANRNGKQLVREIRFQSL